MRHGTGILAMATALDIQALESRSIVDLLLDEQAQTSAVESFSAYHDRLDASDTGVPAQAKYYTSLLPANPPSSGEQYAFEVNLDSCSGCKACVVACHTLNGLEEEEAWRRVGSISAAGPGLSNGPILRHVTTACHHCADPGCLNGCPVKAYEKSPETGIVKHLDDQCIGCKYCTMMCPYEVPKYSKRLGIVRKCDMCSQRLATGEAPACVQSCPNEAIAIRLVTTSPADGLSKDDRLVPGAPLSSVTQPSTVYRTTDGPALLNATPMDAGVDHAHESHWPLAVMLCCTQASVGILAVERLGSLFVTSAETTRFTLIVAFALAAMGLGIAPLHLGQPLRAWRVFLGLRTSWLSREAILLGKYAGLVAVLAALSWSSYLSISPFSTTTTTEIVEIGAWLAIALGVVALFSSGMIYVATRRELWNLQRTMLQFFGTMISTGGLCYLATVLALDALLDGQANLGGAAVVGVIALVCFTCLAAWEWRFRLGPDRESDSSMQRRSRRVIRRELQLHKNIRLGTAAVTFAVLGCCLMLNSSSVSFALGLAAATLCMGSELCSRLIYFSSIIFDRMPGGLK